MSRCTVGLLVTLPACSLMTRCSGPGKAHPRVGDERRKHGSSDCGSKDVPNESSEWTETSGMQPLSWWCMSMSYAMLLGASGGPVRVILNNRYPMAVQAYASAYTAVQHVPLLK